VSLSTEQQVQEKFVTVLQVDKVLAWQERRLHDFLFKIRRKQTLGKNRSKMVVSDSNGYLISFKRSI
jgi:hypothetical protein